MYHAHNLFLNITAELGLFRTDFIYLFNVAII